MQIIVICIYDDDYSMSDMWCFHSFIWAQYRFSVIHNIINASVYCLNLTIHLQFCSVCLGSCLKFWWSSWRTILFLKGSVEVFVVLVLSFLSQWCVWDELHVCMSASIKVNSVNLLLGVVCEKSNKRYANHWSSYTHQWAKITPACNHTISYSILRYPVPRSECWACIIQR